MTIILSSQAGINSGNTVSNVFGDLGKALGISGFPQPGAPGSYVSDILAVSDKINGVLDKLMGKGITEKFDPNYVESGRQVVVGGAIDGGKVPPLEAANIRQVYTQTPQVSVVVRKKTFSSLKDLYNPIFMDPSEKWLFRATKKLIENKCLAIAQYEKISKVEKLIDAGASAATIITSLMSSLLEDSGDQQFSSVEELRKVIYDRQPVSVTTYFTDPDMPLIEELGPGTGAFEITLATSISTSLGLDGEGNFNFSIEDPYRILFITEEDIETALKGTALSNVACELNSASGRALDSAQSTDALLQAERKRNGKSEISFTVEIGTGVVATIDAIGLIINENNFDIVPENQSLNSTERALFISVMTGLTLYQKTLNSSLINGINVDSLTSVLKKQIDYARERMRTFYLGKCMIQPMDAINIFIAGGTRRLGEGENPNPDEIDLFSASGGFKIASNILGSDELIDDGLLMNEWKRAGSFPDFDTFKKIRTLTLTTEEGTHVFGGLVNSVDDKFDANSGTHTINISGASNMEWLRISRYNESPSLDQTQGVVYDPLTPFDFEVDPATGLPIGKPKLNDANALIGQGSNQFYFASGPKTGKQIKTIEDMNQDIAAIGNNMLNLYQHAPGLVYKWKKGIVTATYNMFNVDPKDGSQITSNQLRRDVGFFASNTPFDNMDAANVLSILITGAPYNPATFIQSALNNGSYIPDATLNSGRDFFRHFLNIQKSIVKTHGNFVPFKSINVSPSNLAKAIYYQQQLSGKSVELTQLRSSLAKLEDQQNNLLGTDEIDKRIRSGLQIKKSELENKINNLATSLSELTASAAEQETKVIQIAGNDISYDLGSITNEEEFKLFGDRLAFSVLRRKEDVIRNIDKNYFIVSDEYDKDYDIQAFVMKLRERAPDMWKMSYKPLIDLCKEVADILAFEFYCDTNGHIVFRPPQYNRVPASILNQMLSLNKLSGIKLFPDFLSGLFQSREDRITRDVTIKEWEIRKEAALLGMSDVKDVEIFLAKETGVEVLFITNADNGIKYEADMTINPKQRLALSELVESSNYQSQLSAAGLFSAVAQRNLQKTYIEQTTGTKISISNEQAYDNAVNNLTALTGQQKRNEDEFAKIKVGVKKNGISTPATDISQIITRIAQLVSERSQLMKTLSRALTQNIEIASISGSDGNISFNKVSFNVNNLPEGLYNKLIEDDTKDLLGHMSAGRFVIKDENIISSNFSEKVTQIMTNCTITGTAPLVGDNGGINGVPIYTAFGVDFDLWRQYGWRGEKTIHKPFFSNADYQCAPYAVMLLSRQRANIVTGDITVFGNEFYQLGDVVYVTHRQMLYYVSKIQHNFNYESGLFSTTLSLQYGHPVGQYIPTPLDVIGKLQITSGTSQGSFRVRREPPRTDDLLGTVVFDKDSEDLFSGKYARRNFNQLSNAAIMAQTVINKKDPKNSARVYCMTFFGDETTQHNRAAEVGNWFLNPSFPASSKGGIGIGGAGLSLSVGVGINDDITKLNIDPSLIRIQRLNQSLSSGGTLSPEEEDLLSKGITASQEAISIDPGLGNVVEIRIRQAPIGGWKD
jgi:hypothetical protein